MPIDPVKIPQNVYIEDRIVGPLTLRQIIIVAIGCGFSYALWSSISKAYGVVAIPITILVWVPGVLSIAFAFVRVNDLSLLHLCFLFLERLTKPATRTWAPRRGIIINIKTMATSKELAPPPVNLQEKKAQRISELSAALDQPSEDEAEVSAEPMIQAAPVTTETALPVDPSRIQASTDRQNLMRDLFPHRSHG